MAHTPGAGRCVHCLREVPERNWDHVFPRGWYPDTTPLNLEKWKIPSCKPCNDAYGSLEDDLGLTLSACINPESARASGIWAKTLRALDPSRGKSEKDQRARAHKKEALLSRMLKGKAIPDRGIYPGLGERWARPAEEQIAVRVPAKHFQKLIEKLVKGLAFIQDNRFIDTDFEIVHHVVDAIGAQEFEATLDRFGTRHSRGPGIDVIRAVAPEDGVSSLYKITLWGEIVLYASVTPKMLPAGPADQKGLRR